MAETQASVTKRRMDSSFESITVSSSDSDDTLAGNEPVQRSQPPLKRRRGPEKKNSELADYFFFFFRITDVYFFQRSLSMKKLLKSLCRTQSQYTLFLR